MLEELKYQVCGANLELVARGVVIYTWGNVSGIDRDKGLVVIKPSGVVYDNMSPDDMIVVDLQTGEIVEGKWKPSSDTATHLELYRCYHDIAGIPAGEQTEGAGPKDRSCPEGAGGVGAADAGAFGSRHGRGGRRWEVSGPQASRRCPVSGMDFGWAAA